MSQELVLSDQSADINELAKALCAIQIAIAPLEATKTNPFFHSQYIPLDELLTGIFKAAPRHGVATIQTIEFRDGANLLKTRIVHTSGQWISSEMKLNPVKDTPQGLGSAITYARRYSLMAIFGISQKGDDDGNTASKSDHKPTHSSAPRSQGKGPNEAQMRRWFGIAKTNGYSKELQKEMLVKIFNYKGSRADMPYDIYNNATKHMEDNQIEGDIDSSWPPNNYDENKPQQH